MTNDEKKRMVAAFMTKEYGGVNVLISPSFAIIVKGNMENVFTHDLRYDTSWEWIMPVIQKIEQIDDIIVSMGNDREVYIGGTLENHEAAGINVDYEYRYLTIEPVWEAVTQFLEWYYKHKDNETPVY